LPLSALGSLRRSSSSSACRSRLKVRDKAPLQHRVVCCTFSCCFEDTSIHQGYTACINRARDSRPRDVEDQRLQSHTCSKSLADTKWQLRKTYIKGPNNKRSPRSINNRQKHEAQQTMAGTLTARASPRHHVRDGTVDSSRSPGKQP
jgi:hypothetical protein